MILGVEAWHTLPNTLETLRQSAALLSKDSDARLVIADGFDVTLIQECEAEFSKFFEIC